MTRIRRQDGYSIRIPLTKINMPINNKKKQIEKFLIVSYSAKRARKDKHDREKQIKKAQYMIRSPSSVARRYKYILIDKNKDKYQLNKNLIQKSEQQEGLKGYVTNVSDLTNQEIIQKYSELWQVENSFRMSKSDLKARPIFHTKRESIEAHLLIVFTGLVISRYIEIISKTRIPQVILTLNQINLY
jgi:IS4 transposase